MGPQSPSCSVTLAAVTDICHLSPLCPRAQGWGCADNRFVDSTSSPEWRWGNVSSVFINSLSQACGINIQYIFMLLSHFDTSLTSLVLLHIFKPFLQMACQEPHFCREPHMASYVFTTRPLQTTSTGLKVVTPTDCACVFVCVCGIHVSKKECVNKRTKLRGKWLMVDGVLCMCWVCMSTNFALNVQSLHVCN